jgi:hypothetical protein
VRDDDRSIRPRPKGLPKTGGRQKGVANKRTREIADAAVREGLTPLEYMLAVLRDESVEPDRRDRMAAAAAPYIHPRLSSTQIGATIKRDVTELTRDELVAIIASGARAAAEDGRTEQPTQVH